MGSKISKGNNELFTSHGSILMKSQRSTAHAVQDNYPINKYSTDVEDAVFLYGCAASNGKVNCLIGRLLDLSPAVGLEP